MKRISWIWLVLMGLMVFASCSDDDTYADQKARERNAIDTYIAKSGITRISESQFKEQGYKTDVSRNEYVLFENTGIYLQIVREGCGKKLKSGETATVLCRYTETNLLADTLQSTNNNWYWASVVDKFTVANNSGTFTASFDTSSSVMYRRYGSASVPAGWLVPLTYINLGRPLTEEDEIAKVKIIVPHTQGQQLAAQYVYPCLYEITYERGR